MLHYDFIKNKDKSLYGKEQSQHLTSTARMDTPFHCKEDFRVAKLSACFDLLSRKAGFLLPSEKAL